MTKSSSKVTVVKPACESLNVRVDVRLSSLDSATWKYLKAVYGVKTNAELFEKMLHALLHLSNASMRKKPIFLDISSYTGKQFDVVDLLEYVGLKKVGK